MKSSQGTQSEKAKSDIESIDEFKTIINGIIDYTNDMHGDMKKILGKATANQMKNKF